MFVTNTIEFNQDILDTSIENYIRLNYLQNQSDDMCYYIIMKHIIKYLKNHPESRICEIMSITSMLYKLKDLCLIYLKNTETSGSEILKEFEVTKKLELGLIDDKYSIRKSKIFTVWLYIDGAIEQLEIKCARGDYGYFQH